MNLFNVEEVNYSNRYRNLNIEASGVVKSTKFFPVFLDKTGKEEIFKPLSKTKPLSTPLFAYSEVFWSNIIKKYFDSNAPLYRLAFCRGITDEQEKYQERGTLVPNVLKPGQKLVNLLEYFRENPDRSVDIDNYTNYCMRLYDYTPIFKSELFSKNDVFSRQLAMQVLLSILSRNQNFHYENVSFICEEGKLITLAPPIDHEFSSMFLYPDDEETHYRTQQKYDIELLGILPYMKILKENIDFIAKRHPDVAKRFLEGLNKMRRDLQLSPTILQDDGYIGIFSTDDYQIGIEGIKERNKKEAIRLEKEIAPKRTQVDLQKFSVQLIKETIHNIDILERIIKLQIKTDKQQDIDIR